MIRLGLIAWSALLLAAAPARAQDAREALIRSIEQESRVNYAGLQTTVVTDRGKTRTAQQVVKRRAPDKLRIEYQAPARLRGELVVDDGKRLRHYVPSLRVVEEGPSQVRKSLDRQQKRIQSLRAGKTTVALVGEDTLLGRRVTVVTVSPAKPDRPSRTLWLDGATGVALRIEDRFPGGRTSVTSFVQISFDPILGPAEFELPIPQGVTVVPASMGRPIPVRRAEQTAARLWGGMPEPTFLPPGFALTSAHQLRFHKQPVIAVRYTRGREELSLFVSASAGEPFSAPMDHHVNVFQRPIGRMLVTLVGALPSEQLQRVAESLRLPDGPGMIQPPLAARSRPRPR
jgi:outer membrane lipoprotein-sorting protein